MDPQKRTLIVTGIVLLLILAVIFGTVFFLIKTLTSRPRTASNPNPTNTIFPVQSVSPASPFPTINIGTATPSPSPRGAQTSQPTNNQPANRTSPAPSTAASLPSTGVGDSKVYTGQGFAFNYPKSWGLLTCSNSQNIELDPTNGVDQLNSGCGFAIKPITILVNEGTGCRGETVTLGNVQVVKQVQKLTTGVNYKWCTQTTPKLEISHRVNSAGGRATSTQDFSTQVEQMISTLKFGSGS